MSFNIKWSDKGVQVSFQGDIQVTEIFSANDLVCSDIRFQDCCYQLYDFSEANLSEMSLDDVHDLVIEDRYASVTYPEIKLAIVAVDDYQEAVCSHYVNLSDLVSNQWEIKIFRNVEEASNWCLLTIRLNDYALIVETFFLPAL